MEIKLAVKALSALAQDSRLTIFRLLVRHGPVGVTPGTIAEQLGLPAPTLSFHLGQLENAGLIVSKREGRSVIYAANYESMQALIGFLMKNCCKGTGEQCNETISRPRSRRKSR